MCKLNRVEYKWIDKSAPDLARELEVGWGRGLSGSWFNLAMHTNVKNWILPMTQIFLHIYNCC
jgi:hypothetical protein